MRRPASRLVSTLVLVAALPATALLAQGPSPASTWHSDVPERHVTPDDLWGIGGSGQINGAFVLDTYFDGSTNTAIQIGFRAQQRTVGPFLDQVGAVFFAETGESSANRAWWNFDFHLDFGTLEEDALPDGSLEATLRTAGFLGAGELVPLNLRDFDAEVWVDLDPSGATSFNVTDLDDFIAAYEELTMTSHPEVRLFQESQNPKFDTYTGAGNGAAFDVFAEGLYGFRLVVRDPGSGEVLVQSAIQVSVQDTPIDTATADVAVGIAESVDPIVLDDSAGNLVYTLTVTNHSATDAAADVVVDAALGLPAGTSYTGDSASTGVVTGTAEAIQWTIGSLAAGASETLELTVTVDTSAAVGAMVTASADVTSSTPDGAPANNGAVAATTIDCLDGDADGVCDRDDNCSAAANPGQQDSDDDGNGNACDLCIGDDATGDDDADGVCDGIDLCTGSDFLGDADGDGLCADLDCDDGDPTNACALFADGFEAGDTTDWSSTVP